MIVVSLNSSGREIIAWINRHAIFLFVHVDTEPSKFSASGMDTVRLFEPRRGNTADSRRRGGERRNRRQRLRGVGNIAHVNVNATQRLSASDFNEIFFFFNLTSRLLQNIEKCNISLFGFARDIFELEPSRRR